MPRYAPLCSAYAEHRMPVASAMLRLCRASDTGGYPSTHPTFLFLFFLASKRHQVCCIKVVGGSEILVAQSKYSFFSSDFSFLVAAHHRK